MNIFLLQKESKIADLGSVNGNNVGIMKRRLSLKKHSCTLFLEKISWSCRNCHPVIYKRKYTGWTKKKTLISIVLFLLISHAKRLFITGQFVYKKNIFTCSLHTIFTCFLLIVHYFSNFFVTQVLQRCTKFFHNNLRIIFFWKDSDHQVGILTSKTKKTSDKNKKYDLNMGPIS